MTRARLIARLLLAGMTPALMLAPRAALAQQPAQAQAAINLTALYAPENRPIRSGVTWRILQEDVGGGPPRIVARSDSASTSLSLPQGQYVVHAAYGYASAWKRVTVPASGAVTERVVLNAGALRLAGSIGDRLIPPALITFAVFVPLAGNSEGRLVTDNVKAGDTLRLPEGTYHVVSTHGDANAIRRTDIKVESGRLIEAVIQHRAAKATLKLVAQRGGEAFAGTAFTVLTPGGDVIREAIGAFPEVILAEGEYVLIARQGGQVHTTEFRIEAGLDKDVEVIVGR